MVIPLSMTGCPNPITVKWAPDNFPGSVWSAENGNVWFSVEEESQERFVELVKDTSTPHNVTTRMFGEINVGEDSYEFFVYSSVNEYAMSFISQEIPKCSENYYETLYEYMLVDFDVTYKSKEHFVATVEQSKLFEEGTEFEFFKVDVEKHDSKKY